MLATIREAEQWTALGYVGGVVLLVGIVALGLFFVARRL